MGTRKSIMLTLLVSFLVFIALWTPSARAEEQPILVGHISYVEGELFRYVPEEKDWVATVKDAPFGVQDVLYSATTGKAEFLMPNNTWVRIDGETQVELVALNDTLAEIDLPAGTARVYNKSSQAVAKIFTPYGYALAPPATTVDVWVGEDSVEVIARRGTVDFLPVGAETKYEVVAGSASLVARRNQVTAGEGKKNQAWNLWNQERDNMWARREQQAVASADYLPPELSDEAYILSEQGRWDNVYYEGAYYHFWRPLYVGWGWSPFTVGRWTMWCGDHTWIPAEPFGYLTHHYGNWVYANSFWYWAPPVRRFYARPYPSFLNISYAWYPGRVAWLHDAHHVGWVPLAPYERYYCHRPWGPHSVVVNNINFSTINLNRHHYRYYGHAVVVDSRRLYTVNDYRGVRVRNQHYRANDDYRVAPVVNDEVLSNFSSNRERFQYTTASYGSRPNRGFTGNMVPRQPAVSGSAVSTSNANPGTREDHRYQGRMVLPSHVNDGPGERQTIGGPTPAVRYQGGQTTGSLTPQPAQPSATGAQAKQGLQAVPPAPGNAAGGRSDHQVLYPRKPTVLNEEQLPPAQSNQSQKNEPNDHSVTRGGGKYFQRGQRQMVTPPVNDGKVPAPPSVSPPRSYEGGAAKAGLVVPQTAEPRPQTIELKQGEPVMATPPVKMQGRRPGNEMGVPNGINAYTGGSAPRVEPRPAPQIHTPERQIQTERAREAVRNSWQSQAPQQRQIGNQNQGNVPVMGSTAGTMNSPPRLSAPPQAPAMRSGTGVTSAPPNHWGGKAAISQGAVSSGAASSRGHR